MNCFAFPRLILRTHTHKKNLFMGFGSKFLHFFFSSICWELVTWKEEVFWKWLKWDVSLHKLTVSKNSPWKQWRLKVFMPYEKARQKNLQPFKLPSVTPEIQLCTSWRGRIFSHTFAEAKNCGGNFFFSLMHWHLLDWSLQLHSQGDQTPLKVTTCFSSAWILFKYALWAQVKILAEYECLRFMCLSAENPGLGYWRSAQDGGSSQT